MMQTSNRSKLEPDPVDVHVGGQIRRQRTVLGWSQDRLAGHLGVSFQQLQKYEAGSNRTSASMMHRAATALGVPVSFFFTGLQDSLEDADSTLSREALQMAVAIERLPTDVREPLTCRRYMRVMLTPRELHAAGRHGR